MKSVPLIACVAGTILLAVFVPPAAMALPIAEAYEAIGDDLVAAQGRNGAWRDEEGYTGSIVAGLAAAYEFTGKADYKAAAELGADFIFNSAGGNFYGDEAYALTLLTDITGDAAYADAARNFYDGLDTAAYINGFTETDASNAVFYVAQHTVAAHKAGAMDAGMWREGLIQYLSWIDDDVAEYPVMSLGVATWALAQTGPMDATPIDSSGTGEAYWANVALSDLPGLLVGHQDFSKRAYEGVFYVRFDHGRVTGAEVTRSSGFTEDTVFGVLGLIEADNADPNLGFASNIVAGRTALTRWVSSNGAVREHISAGGASYYTYGGEVLQTVPEPEPATSLSLHLLQDLQSPRSRRRHSFRPPLGERR